MKKLQNVMWVCVCIFYFLILTPTAAKSQSLQEGGRKIAPSVADQQAAQESGLIYRHVRAANTAAGRTMKSEERAAAPSPKAIPATDSSIGLRFPADLTYLGGPVVTSAESHAIYLIPLGSNCAPVSDCWGNPEGFLTDLASSDFVHLLDQYTGVSGSYTVGPNAMIPYRQSAASFTDADIQVFVHTVAAKDGGGYGHIYHVFLPPGQDECFSANSHSCYSPDDPKTFVFCAYHNSVDFKDIGHVLYSVEPFQDVPGCSVRQGTPNGQLADSTNNTLAHELFEMISDPDGTAWLNFSLVALAGEEIGDECSFFTVTADGVFFDPSVFSIGSHQYAVDPEYSNSAHACAVGP